MEASIRLLELDWAHAHASQRLRATVNPLGLIKKCVSISYGKAHDDQPCLMAVSVTAHRVTAHRVDHIYHDVVSTGSDLGPA